jgi:hypothetical protein
MLQFSEVFVSPGSAGPVHEYPLAPETQLRDEFVEQLFAGGPALIVAVHPAAALSARSKNIGRPTPRRERAR